MSEVKTPFKDELNLHTWVDCTSAEGPGQRFALWVQGCPIRCPGCCNPEMFANVPRNVMTTDEALAMILKSHEKNGVEGITVLGGEPFTQAGPLSILANKLKAHGLSTMVFSGYTLDELKTQDTKEANEAFLAEIDILVDGRYEESLHTDKRRWIGSTNQQVHFLTDRYSLDDAWSEGNTFEITFDGKEIQVAGFPNATWQDAVRLWQKSNRNKSKKKPEAT